MAPGEAVPELEEEPRLPDPGLADEPDGLAPAFLDGGEEIQQRRELPVAADEVAEPVGAQALERRAARPHAEESNHDDRLAPALDLNGSDALAADVALDEPPRRLARENRARLGQLLEAGGEVGGVADRRVIHAQVVADRAHDDETGVKAHPDRQRDLGPPDGDGAVAERAGDAEGGERRAACVILVREGRAEERHEAVAEELVDRALVAMHLGEGGLEEGIHENVHSLRPEPLGQRRGADQVAEEHGDGFALAFQRAPGGEDPLGEVPRRVGGRRRLGRGGPASRSRGGDGVAALRAELRGLGELRPARGAGEGEPLPALQTELRPRGILVPAPRTEHRGSWEVSVRGGRYPVVTSWQNWPTR